MTTRRLPLVERDAILRAMKPIALLFVLCFARVASAEPVAFTQLRSLVGSWEATSTKGSTIQVSYRLTANESVLVEEWMPGSSRATLTVFHSDKKRVIATHYCSQGNQPRLQLNAGSTADRWVFTYFDATNLSPGAAHLVRLEFALDGAAQLVKTETYDEGGKPDVTVLRFHRVRK